MVDFTWNKFELWLIIHNYTFILIRLVLSNYLFNNILNIFKEKCYQIHAFTIIHVSCIIEKIQLIYNQFRDIMIYL